jgi:hypothetical protein
MMPVCIHDEIVDGAGVRQVEKMPGAGDDTIGMNAANGNETIAITVDVMNRHR